VLDGDRLPEREIPVEYLAEGVRAPQVSLVRGPSKLVRGLGEPDLFYDLERDPHERSSGPGEPELVESASSRWDIARLDADVRASQEARRLVASALATGRVAAWDHPTADGDGPYIRTGQDFWSTLESRRRP
jgi:choline-sulfatase